MSLARGRLAVSLRINAVSHKRRSDNVDFRTNLTDLGRFGSIPEGIVAPHYFKRGTPMVERACRHCGALFHVPARVAKRENRGVFCGLACNNAAIATRRSANQSGEKNPNWKGGVSADHMRYRRRFVAKSPEKLAAQRAFQSAVRRGAIVPPETCSACGVTCKAHGHHDD